MTKLLRDVFNPKHISNLSDRISKVYPDFDSSAFVDSACRNLSELDYTERIEHITDCLAKYLPDDFTKSVDILCRSLPKPPEYEKDVQFRDEGFMTLPATRYVSKFGADRFEESMQALRMMTPSFTAEYDIRQFIMQDKKRSLELLYAWAKDPDLHVRRLASEGSRPRLPMGKRLHEFVKDPSPILPILEKLKDDPVLYVRRSVANSLNDISKDHPDLAADIAEKWLKTGGENIQWVCRHAMRTLLKKGHAKALAICGFPYPEGIMICGLQIRDTSLKTGDALEFSFLVSNTGGKTLCLMADFEISFMKSNGRNAPKVFKLKKFALNPGKETRISGRFSFEPRSTRSFYTGRHIITPIINGQRGASASFYFTNSG